MRGREQDSGETEIESVLETVCCREKDSVSNKIDRCGKTWGANGGLISEMIGNVADDVVPANLLSVNL